MVQSAHCVRGQLPCKCPVSGTGHWTNQQKKMNFCWQLCCCKSLHMCSVAAVPIPVCFETRAADMRKISCLIHSLFLCASWTSISVHFLIVPFLYLLNWFRQGLSFQFSQQRFMSCLHCTAKIIHQSHQLFQSSAALQWEPSQPTECLTWGC